MIYTFFNEIERMKFLPIGFIVVQFHLVFDVHGIDAQYETNYAKSGICKYIFEDHSITQLLWRGAGEGKSMV